MDIPEEYFSSAKCVGDPPRHILVAWVMQSDNGAYYAMGFQLDARTGAQEHEVRKRGLDEDDAEGKALAWIASKVQDLEEAA